MKRQLKITGLSVSLMALLGICAPAVAKDKPSIDVTVSGYFTQSLNLVDADTTEPSGERFEDEVLAQNGEIHFKAKTKLAGGGTIGVRVELEAEGSSKDLIDEHYLYIKDDWGKVIIGAENGVGHLMQVRAPRFVPGLKMFDNSVNEKAIEETYDAQLGEVDVIEDPHMSTKLEHISGDANKLSYLTAKVSGLQMGVSYTPNNADRNGGKNNVISDTSEIQEDILELAMRYSGFYRGAGYRLSYSQVEGSSLGQAADPKSTSTGLQVYWSDWVFGANLSEYNDLDALPDTKYTDSERIETLNLGLKYKQGDSYWGLGFTDSEETDVGSVGPATEYKEVMIGGGKKLTAGVQFGYYYQMTEVDRKGTSAEANILGMTLALTF